MTGITSTGGGMDFPALDQMPDGQARALVVGLLQDAERQLVTAVFNRVMNPGPSGENFSRDADKLRAGIALVRGNPTWARYLDAGTLSSAEHVADDSAPLSL